QTDCGLSGEIFGAPMQKSAGGTDLLRNQRFRSHVDFLWIVYDMITIIRSETEMACSQRKWPVPKETSFLIQEEDVKSSVCTKSYESRRAFSGGSDARIIMGSDEAALVRLWREKRGEAEPEDLSDNLVVQLGRATEELNRSWYERNTGRQ